jgi:hypothetical protein
MRMLRALPSLNGSGIEFLCISETSNTGPKYLQYTAGKLNTYIYEGASGASLSNTLG